MYYSSDQHIFLLIRHRISTPRSWISCPFVSKINAFPIASAVKKLSTSVTSSSRENYPGPRSKSLRRKLIHFWLPKKLFILIPIEMSEVLYRIKFPHHPTSSLPKYATLVLIFLSPPLNTSSHDREVTTVWRIFLCMPANIYS